MSINASIIWIVIGLILCIAEFIQPNVWITFIMGLSALIVAVFWSHLSIPLQIAAWIGGQYVIWQFITLSIFITNLLFDENTDSQE